MVDAQAQNDQFTSDRSNFWRVVDRTKAGKLYLFSENELRDCQNYFSKVQSDSAVSPNELIMAAERLTLIRSEIDVRHGDANYRRALRLARWAIGLAMIPLTGATVFGVAQFLRRQPARKNWPMETSTMSTAMAVEVPTSTPELTQPPNAIPDVTRPSVFDISTDEHINTDTKGAGPDQTSKPTPKHKKTRLKRETRRSFPLVISTQTGAHSVGRSATIANDSIFSGLESF